MLQLQFMLDELSNSYPEFTFTVNSHEVSLYATGCRDYITSVFSSSIPKRLTISIREKIYNKIKLTMEVYYNVYKDIAKLNKEISELSNKDIEFKINNKMYRINNIFSLCAYKFVNKDDNSIIETRHIFNNNTVEITELKIFDINEFKNMTIAELNKILIKHMQKANELRLQIENLVEKRKELFKNINIIC